MGSRGAIALLLITLLAAQGIDGRSVDGTPNLST
jgi:hypothetical protein